MPVLKGFNPKKQANKNISEGLQSELEVEVVANMVLYMDNDDDVLMRGAYNKSIRDKGASIPFLRDHIHEVGAIIAETLEVSARELDLAQLGIASAVDTSEALVFRALVKRVYNKQVFTLYEDGLINQHSIGLQYVDLELAIDDPQAPQEKSLFDKVLAQMINPERARERGFMWVVNEIKVFENSAVLFGSNEATPTLDIIGRAANAGTSSKAGTPSKDTLKDQQLNFYLNL